MATTTAKPHSLIEIQKLLRGEMTSEQARGFLATVDRKALNPVTFAAMKGAVDTEKLLPLLDLLEPPGEEETSKMDELLDVLEKIADSQGRIERRLAAIESRIGGSRPR